jgi:hypothetical protein
MAFDWGSFWPALQGVALCATAFIAWYQIGALRRDQKAWKTLEACERYESDEVLTEALKVLRDARDSGRLKENPRPFRMEASTLLNYLEGIATGQAQGFYNQDIVRDHLEPIIRDHIAEFLEPDMARRMEIDPSA